MTAFPFPRIVTVMTGAALFVGPSAIIAQTAGSRSAMTTAMAQPASPDRALITTFTKVDRDEVLMSRAALPTLQDPEVKRYAERMIDDHSAHLNATTTIATRLGVTAEPETTPGGAVAPTTDQQYIDAMVSGHQQLLAQLPKDGNGIQDQALRQLLTDTRRTVQGHLDDALRLKGKLGGRTP